MRRIGTEASGTLELPLYGGLTVGESAMITELLAKEQSTFVAGARIAEAIAKAEDISLTEAFSLIENSIRGNQLEDDAEAIRIRHADKVEQVARIYATAGQRNMTATVTALIRSRLNQQQWGLEDTLQMHRSLFMGIWQLAEDEQAAENSEPAAPPDEETLGKPQEVAGKPPRRTGGHLVTT